MRKTSKYKYSMHLFTLSITILLLTILTACGSANNQINASSDEENKSKQSNNKDEKFAQIEDEFDAQLGVYAINTETNETIEYQPNERFAYASTFKALAAAILLKQNNLEDLEKVITYNEDDLVSHSPVTEKHVDSGMTLLEISEAAIRKSDNTAANFLLEAIGGPDNFEKALRDIGDDVTQSERYETELNEFSPENKRDTSTPKTMATNLKKVILSDYLPDNKRKLLSDWMTGNEAGDSLIRAGAPSEWTVLDKSGAGNYGTRNDIAVVKPPSKEPIVIAIMSRHDTEDAEYEDTLIAKAAEITLNALQ